MEGRQEKLGFGSFKGRVSRLRGLPPKFCIPLVFGHMSARSDLRENVFWTPPGCAVAMNLNLSGGSSVGSAVLMCILRSVKHIADRSWEK